MTSEERRAMIAGWAEDPEDHAKEQVQAQTGQREQTCKEEQSQVGEKAFGETL